MSVKKAIANETGVRGNIQGESGRRLVSQRTTHSVETEKKRWWRWWRHYSVLPYNLLASCWSQLNGILVVLRALETTTENELWCKMNNRNRMTLTQWRHSPKLSPLSSLWCRAFRIDSWAFTNARRCLEITCSFFRPTLYVNTILFRDARYLL